MYRKNDDRVREYFTDGGAFKSSLAIDYTSPTPFFVLCRSAMFTKMVYFVTDT